MPVFFAFTLFVSSALLFLLQPMFARMILPRLGGSPAVWNTCMVFFQAVLLAGYLYAHLASRLSLKRQIALHLGLLLLPVLVLPLQLPLDWRPPRDANPIPWLLALLSVSVGLPFFVISTSAPLLQKWFASAGNASARDPYFLYAASNLGSMLALLSYPFLVEPSFSLQTQHRLWSAGYLVLALLTTLCAVFLWSATRSTLARSVSEGAAKSDGPTSETLANASGWYGRLARQPRTTDHGLPTSLRLRWIALAFVPSSLMLSVTTYLTTDIAAIPLLWVIPLAIYLLTFILVFARRPLVPQWLMVRLLPLVVLVLTLVMLSEATALAGLPTWPLLVLHLVGLFVVGMVCHGELARSRPPVEHLTDFYLWLSVGGALGGLFNSLLAPLLFSTIAEYPLVLVLACLLRPAGESASEKRGIGAARRPDFVLPLALAIGTIALVIGLQAFGVEPGRASLAFMFIVPTALCYTFAARPLRFGLGIAALFLAGGFYHGIHGKLEYRARSFFGVHRVTLDASGRFRQLVHGDTIHGRQSLSSEHRREPLLYYHRTGPIGQVFEAYKGADAKMQIAIVGLGAGSLAAYGEPGQEITYYEIDPTVVRLASDERFFTFLRNSQAHVHVVLGDARLTLEEAPDRHYGLIVLDAFSSDAIPLHLLTREALRLYHAKLADDGILAFHISNRYLDLEPVLGKLAQDTGLVCWAQANLVLSPAEKAAGKEPSWWVVMARSRPSLEKLIRTRRWLEVKPRPDVSVWTDDFSNLFSVFKWKADD
jgi:hypothetical protein